MKHVRVTQLALTQHELALELGVSDVIVSRWERGKSEPSLRFIRALAQMSGKPVSWFFEEGQVAA